MSAVRYPTVLKTSTFSIKDCEKHFQYVCYLYNSITNLENISQTNNTHRGHCSNRIDKFASRYRARGEFIEAYLK